MAKEQPDLCPKCNGDGYFFRLPHGKNPFMMRIEQVASMSEKMTCGSCYGTGLRNYLNN